MKNRKGIGVLLSLVLAAIMFSITIGFAPISKLNRNLTSNGGDALKDVYTTYYNAKYDSSFVRNNAMNYPYGDHYTYTGDQIFISWTIKATRNIGLGDFSNYVIAAINSCVFLSVFLCVLFLFLIFYELKLPMLLSALGAVLITFLSPQMGRISAHLTLSYSYLIPLIIYLFFRFYRKPSIACSIFIGVTLFICGISHPYYMMFFASIFGMFWLYILLNERKNFGSTKLVITAILLQFVIPLICFFMLTKIGDSATDRTNVPWGFYAYRGRIEGVIFPYMRTYFSKPSFLADISWGAVSYIGLVADIALFYILYLLTKRLIARNYTQALKVTSNKLLNLFFWTGVILLLASLLLPQLPERLLNYVGILAQMRGLSRFTWLFYYMINILVFYWLANYAKQGSKNFWLRCAVVGVVLLCYGFESYKYSSSIEAENDFPALFDYNNKLPQNQLLSQIDANRYQSILALPYFHIGSEHIWLEARDNMFASAVYVSMKTGLPMHNNMSSRASISQAYSNIALSWEPFRQYQILDSLKSCKPILTITKTGKNSLNSNEQRIIAHSTFLFTENGLNYYQTEIDSLKGLCSQYSIELYKKYRNSRLFAKSAFVYSNGSSATYHFQGWDSLMSQQSFQGKGALSSIINKPTTLYEGELHVSNTDSAEISFLMGDDYTADLFGRTSLQVITSNTEGKRGFYYKSDIFRSVVNVIDGWALVRISIPTSPNYNALHISVCNKNMLAKPIYFDNLTIKPIGLNVIVETDELKSLNNLPVLHIETEEDKSMTIDSILYIPNSILRAYENAKRQEAIDIYKTRIKSSTEWMQQIQEKAKIRNISVDSMVTLDATYLATHD